MWNLHTRDRTCTQQTLNKCESNKHDGERQQNVYECFALKILILFFLCLVIDRCFFKNSWRLH